MQLVPPCLGNFYTIRFWSLLLGRHALRLGMFDELADVDGVDRVKDVPEEFALG